MGSQVRTPGYLSSVHAGLPLSHVDVLKGSYYANIYNPALHAPPVPEAERIAHPENYGDNICESDSHLAGVDLLMFKPVPFRAQPD